MKMETSWLLTCFFYFRFLIALQLLGLLTISLYVGASEPDNFDNPDNSGIAAMNEGRYDDAYQYFSSQRSQQDRKNSALFYLAQISLAKEDADTAKTHIESSLEILPNNSEEHKLAGDIYCNLAQQSSIFSALKLAKKMYRILRNGHQEGRTKFQGINGCHGIF